MTEESPFNALPAVVLLPVLAMVGVELLFLLAGNGMVGGADGVGWRLAAIEDYAFAPQVIDVVTARGSWSPDLLKRFVTYAFVHGSFTQVAFAAVILLAMGKFVSEALDGAGLAVVLLLSTVIGALVFGLLAPVGAILYGAYPAAYGLIGAYTYVLWVHFGRRGERQIAAFRLIGFLVGIQIVFSLLFMTTTYLWIAELTGFAIGFVVTPVLVPGGWQRLLQRIRTR